MRHLKVIEQKIIKSFIKAAFNNYCDKVIVFNVGCRGEEAISVKEGLRLIGHTGYNRIELYKSGKYIGFALFIWGNDEDCLSDYTDNETMGVLCSPFEYC